MRKKRYTIKVDLRGVGHATKHGQNNIGLVIGCLKYLLGDRQCPCILLGCFCHFLFHYLLKFSVELSDQKGFLFHFLVNICVQPRLPQNVHVTFVIVRHINDSYGGRLLKGIFFMPFLVFLKESIEGRDC